MPDPQTLIEHAPYYSYWNRFLWIVGTAVVVGLLELAAIIYLLWRRS